MADKPKIWAENMRLDIFDAREYGFETVEHLGDTIPYSESISAYLDAMQSTGIADMLSKVGISHRQDGILLVGPQGTGKHDVATAIIATLIENSTFTKWIWLTAEDFEDMEEDEVVDCLMQLFMPYGQKERIPREIFFLEYAEKSKHESVLMEAISDFFRGCEENGCETPFLLIVTKKDEGEYSYLFRKLMRFDFKLPNFDRRNAYLSRCFVYSEDGITEDEKGKIRIIDMTVNELAKKTKGLNYPELFEFVTMCKLCAVYKAIGKGVWDADNFNLADFPIEGKDVLSFLSCEEEEPYRIVPQYNVVATAPDITTNQNVEKTDLKEKQEGQFDKNTISRLEKMISNNSYNPAMRALLDHKF